MAPFRYRKPGYVALNVTNIERSVRFYRDLVGLQLEAQDEDEAYLRCSDDHHNLVLCKSDAPGLKRMAFELESDDDVERAAGHIAARGWPLREVPEAECERLCQGRTLRFRIPASQLVFEFYAQMFGWTKSDAMPMGEMGTYQLFNNQDGQVGGMMRKPDNVPMPNWGYYFRVADIDTAAAKIKAEGGQILNGPMDVPGDDRIINGVDPQGAHFSVVAKKH